MRTPVLRQTSVLGSLLMTILMLSLAPELMAQATLVFKQEIGSGMNSSGDGELNGPEGVAIASDGSILVVDARNSRVQKFNQEGSYVSQFGSNGTADGEFNIPEGIAIDSQGNIFVVDRNNHRVQKFNSSFTHLKTIGTTTASATEGDFNEPSGITIDQSDNIYVVEINNNRVQKFSNDGTFIKAFGTTGDGTLSIPFGIAIDASDNVYVTDLGSTYIFKFNSEGMFQSKFGGSSATEDGKFQSPVGIALDSKDNIYVSDDSRDDIQIFSSAGTYLTKFSTDAATSKVEAHLAFDGNGTLYISDDANDRVKIYTPAQEINLLQGSTEIASAGTVDFGDVGVGTTSTLAFTIENLGGIDLAFLGTTDSQVVLSGDHAADFSVTQTEVGDDLEGFSSVSFTVTYTPATLGSNTATLTINSNDEDESTYTIDLTAMAVDITAPAFTSAATASVEENTAGVAYTVATDDATATITLGTSKDESLFTLANENEISFTASPDFEDPKDGDANNEYVLDVIAEDESGNSATLEVTITVTDANDNPLSVFNENKIGIYPNPAVEVVSIADASVKYAVVYNLMGAKVYAAELENGTLNVKSLRKGLYVLTLMDGVGNILSTNRLMKE